MRFKDREDAGRRLAEALKEELRGAKDIVVVALPRGGVVLGRVVADALGAPLRLVVPRKIGAPWNPEYAVAALVETGHVIWNEAERASVDPKELERIVEEEKREARRRMSVYGKGIPPRDVRGKTAVVVDDGIATGLTMRAALASLRDERPARLLVAVPVAPPSTLEEMKGEADAFVVLHRPALLGAIGAFYDAFDQVTDDEVIALLAKERT